MSKRQSQGFRVAIVGAHGSGKTTLAHEVVAQLKRRHVAAGLCREAARESHYITAGLRVPAMQVDVFARQLSAEMEAIRTNELVICDRTLLDILIYTEMFFPNDTTQSERQMIAAMQHFVDSYMGTYRLIFRTTALFSLIKTADDIRPTDLDLQKTFHTRLESELKRRNLVAFDVPQEDGGAFILETITKSTFTIPRHFS